MKYHITIKNNATGEVLVDKDTEVFFVVDADARRTSQVMGADSTPEALWMLLRAAKHMQKAAAALLEVIEPFEETLEEANNE